MPGQATYRMGASSKARQPFKRPTIKNAVASGPDPPVASSTVDVEQEASEVEVESSRRRGPKPINFTGYTLRSRAQIEASKPRKSVPAPEADELDEEESEQEQLKPVLRKTSRRKQSVQTDAVRHDDGEKVVEVAQTPATRSKGKSKALPTPPTLTRGINDLDAELDVESDGESEDEDFVDEERAQDAEDEYVAEILAETYATEADEDQVSEAESSAGSDDDPVRAHSRKRTRSSKAPSSKGKGGKAGSSKRRKASTRKNGRRTSWRLSDYKYLSLGVPAGDVDAVEVDVDALRKFDDRLRYAARVIHERSVTQLQGGKLSFAKSVCYMAKMLGEKKMVQSFQEYALPHRRAPFGLEDVDEQEAAWNAIAAPTDDELNRKAVYSSRPRGPNWSGRYGGSGTAEAGVPGVGQRLWAYELGKKGAENGQISKANEKCRHTRAACGPDVAWEIRLVLSYPDDVPSALVQLHEGMFVVIEGTVTERLPPSDSAAFNVQNPDYVEATKACMPLDLGDRGDWEPLNGASPLAQGLRRAATAIRQEQYKAAGGKCGCCWQSLALPESKLSGEQNQYKKMTLRDGEEPVIAHKRCKTALRRRDHAEEIEEWLNGVRSVQEMLMRFPSELQEEAKRTLLHRSGHTDKRVQATVKLCLTAVLQGCRCSFCGLRPRNCSAVGMAMINTTERGAVAACAWYWVDADEVAVKCKQCVDTGIVQPKDSRLTAGGAYTDSDLEIPEVKEAMAGAGGITGQYAAKTVAKIVSLSKADWKAPCCGREIDRGDYTMWIPVPEELLNVLEDDAIPHMPKVCRQAYRRTTLSVQKWLDDHFETTNNKTLSKTEILSKADWKAPCCGRELDRGDDTKWTPVPEELLNVLADDAIPHMPITCRVAYRKTTLSVQKFLDDHVRKHNKG